MRQDWVSMMRIRNEARWIRRNLERTFQLVKTVVLWDDGSEDDTTREAQNVLYREPYTMDFVREADGGVLILGASDKATQRDVELHIVRSPFRPALNEMESVSEIRDKNILWWYVKAQVAFKHVLAMDGDEMPSLEFMRHFDEATQQLEEKYDMVDVPFIYLWNDENTRRIDAIYGDRDGTRPGETPDIVDHVARLRFPRMFTIVRCDPFDVFEQRFAWHGHRQGRRVLGGFHCGSVPQENFHPNGGQPVRATYPFPMIHFGYLHREDRVKKHAWYNVIDPGNKYEGEYKHIIEEVNIHAPDPVRLAPWNDV